MNSPRQDNRIRWGILGCARVAEAVVIPGIKLSRNGRALAIASRSLDKAKTFAKKFGIERAYASYEELLDDPDVQAVYLPLPNSMHMEWTLRAAEKGKNILCEKPLASNAEQARKMVQICESKDVLLMEAFAHRFHPQNVLVKELIQQGRIGKVLRITSVHNSGPPEASNIRLSKELAGGALGDKGSYCINTARFILESEPASVYAQVWYSQSGVDERVVAEMTFPSNAVLQFETSFCLAPGAYCQGYEVFGERGRILVGEPFAQLPTYRQGKLVETTIMVTDQQNNVERINVKPSQHWQLEVEYFADCIMNSQQIDFPAEDGLANMIVMDAVFASSRKESPVEILFGQ